MAYQGINILIGTACDMRCPYCLQTGDEIVANRKADIHKFSESLAKYLNGEMPKRIVIWGGEPMIYWEKIKELFDAFRTNAIEPLEGYFITTNGLKMTDEYVEYVNERSVWTTVSAHDWRLPKTQWDKIFQLDNFSISSIIHHKHIDFWDLRRRYYEFEDQYGFKPRFYLHFLRANDGCSPKYYMTKDDVDKLCEHLMGDVITLASLGDDWARWQCNQLLADYLKELKKGNGEKCIREDRLTVDLHGNIYACHHNYDATNICGNLGSSIIPIIPEQPINPRIFSSSEECQSCSIYNECHGGCYLSNTHDVDCYLAKRMHFVYEAMKPVIQWRGK